MEETRKALTSQQKCRKAPGPAVQGSLDINRRARLKCPTRYERYRLTQGLLWNHKHFLRSCYSCQINKQNCLESYILWSRIWLPLLVNRFGAEISWSTAPICLRTSRCLRSSFSNSWVVRCMYNVPSSKENGDKTPLSIESLLRHTAPGIHPKKTPSTRGCSNEVIMLLYPTLSVISL